jgi:hypothetical protein
MGRYLIIVNWPVDFESIVLVSVITDEAGSAVDRSQLNTWQRRRRAVARR